MQYTKGNWKGEKIVRDWLIECEDKPIIATVNGCFNNEVESDANAHLISAAPEMYEALKLYQSHQEGTSGHYCWQCAEAINKALTKAEGK